METIKITVKDINLFDGNPQANILARYNLLLTDKTNNRQYPEVHVDILNDEINSLKITGPTNYDGPIDNERLKDIMIESYNYHAGSGSFLDNFLFFGAIESNSKMHFEIDESGNPVEVHYMNINC